MFSSLRKPSYRRLHLIHHLCLPYLSFGFLVNYAFAFRLCLRLPPRNSVIFVCSPLSSIRARSTAVDPASGTSTLICRTLVASPLSRLVGLIPALVDGAVRHLAWVCASRSLLSLLINIALNLRHQLLSLLQQRLRVPKPLAKLLYLALLSLRLVLVTLSIRSAIRVVIALPFLFKLSMPEDRLLKA